MSYNFLNVLHFQYFQTFPNVKFQKFQKYHISHEFPFFIMPGPLAGSDLYIRCLSVCLPLRFGDYHRLFTVVLGVA